MKKFVVLVVVILIWLAGQSQPRNLQVKIHEVTKVEKHIVHCWGVSLQGDTVYVKYYFRGNWQLVPISKGTWLTIHANYNDKQCEWICRRIKINK